MKDNKTDNKLGPQLESKEKSLTGALNNSASQTARPRFKLKFTDFAIDKFTASFLVNGAAKKKIYTAFDVSKHTILKGLTLCQYKKSQKKYFVLRYWLNGKAYKTTIGQFIKDKFGTKQCEDKIYDIAKGHQDDKGLWIKNPAQTIVEKETRIAQQIIIESEKFTINQVIERYVKAGFPRKKGSTKRASSIKRDSLYLFGHNWRRHHLAFDDVNGKGVVDFKANFHKRTVKPTGWADLFAKFPAGHGIIKNHILNKNDEKSVYDSDLGKLVIDELTPGIVERYLSAKERSPGKQKAILDALNSVWLYARKKGWLGDNPKLNPCRKGKGGIVIEKTSVKADPYKDLRFSVAEYQKISSDLTSLSPKFPFIAEALLLMMWSGLHETDVLRLQKSDVKKDYILVRKEINKNEVRDLYVDITPPVQAVLDLLNGHLKGKYQKYNFIKHLFPTTRINLKRALEEEQYCEGSSTRLKPGSLRGCFKVVKKLNPGLVGSTKNFRKTHGTITGIVTGRNEKTIAITGHESQETFNIHYDKTPRDEQRKLNFEIAKVFKLPKVNNG